MEVDFEHRSPTAEDVIKIGMVDLHDDNKWIELGESRAWGWQQGCMLQWRPGSNSEILWNDRDGIISFAAFWMSLPGKRERYRFRSTRSVPMEKRPSILTSVESRTCVPDTGIRA